MFNPTVQKAVCSCMIYGLFRMCTPLLEKLRFKSWRRRRRRRDTRLIKTGRGDVVM